MSTEATGSNRVLLTGGDHATLTGGYKATMTGGYGAIFYGKYYDGFRFRPVSALVKSEDGIGDLEPNTPYRLNGKGEWEAV